MGKLLLEVATKRPDYATPQAALAMRLSGVRVKDIAALWQISPSRVYQLLERAKNPTTGHLVGDLEGSGVKTAPSPSSAPDAPPGG